MLAVDCRSSRSGMLDGEAAPAKRLRYSPESKHAPHSKSSYVQQDREEQSASASQPDTALTSPSRSSGSVATLAESDSTSEQANASHVSAKGLRVTAAPWTPALNSIWSNAFEPSKGWQSGFDTSGSGAIKPAVAAGHAATGLLGAEFHTRDAQVHSSR